MADLKATSFALRSFGALRADGPVVASLVDADEAYVDFDASGIGYARVGVKRNGAGTSAGAKIRTLNAGAGVDAVTFAANGAASFAAGVTIAGVLTVPGLATFGSAVGSNFININGQATTGAAEIDYQASGTTKWQVGRGVADGSNDFVFYNSALGATAIRIASATSAITLAATLGLGTATYAKGVLTTGVTTGATTVYGGSPVAGTAYVVDVYGSDGATKFFLDRVAYVYGNTPVVISSSTLVGAPAVRTYTVVLGALQLAMASGTYSIRIAPVEIA